MKWGRYDIFELCALALILVFAIALWLKRSSPMAIERGNLAVAGVFVDAVQPSLAGEDRFNRVKLDVIRIHKGCILVHGEVDTHADKEALFAFLDERYPPRLLTFNLRILNKGNAVHLAPDVFREDYRVDRHREERIILEADAVLPPDTADTLESGV